MMMMTTEALDFAWGPSLPNVANKLVGRAIPFDHRVVIVSHVGINAFLINGLVINF